MKTNRKFTVLRLLVLGVLVAGFNAKPASAQILRGKFSLPFTACWDKATLPAGNYSFTLDEPTASGQVTVFRGRQAVALISTRGVSYTTSDHSEMVLQGGMVRELSLPQIGVTLQYPEFTPRHRAAPGQPQVSQIIPVAAAGAGR